MRPDDSAGTGGTPAGLTGAGDSDSAAGPRAPLRLASAVMYVTELGRSATFYAELLAWDVAIRNNSAALLVSPHGFQLYLVGRGPRVPHPLGQVGIQYLMWTADGAEDLRRCEQVLRAQSTRVTTTSGDGFTVVEGRGPDHVPVLITYPGPDEAQRHHIMQRIYEW